MGVVKLTTIGDSLGTTLPAEFVAENNLREGDEVQVTRVPGGLLLTPRTQATEEEQMRLAREIMSRWRPVLRELAK